MRQLTNTAGAITDTYAYDAFGNLIEQTGTTPNLYLYAGEQFDPDLGLYYNRARYLDVRNGRFWGMDILEGDPQAPISLHRYLYAGDNPANATDPTGKEIEETITAATELGLIGTALGASISAGIAITSGIGFLDNIPRDAFRKPPDGKVIGFQTGWAPSGALSKSNNPFLVGLALGLQFSAAIGGVDLVWKNGSDSAWLYGFAGATSGINVSAKGNPLTNGTSSPYDLFGVLGNSAAYSGYVWNLENITDYTDTFYCVSVTPRIRAAFPNAPFQVGGTVCTGEKAPGKEATYTYTTAASPISKDGGTALQFGITHYWYVGTIDLTGSGKP
ncbi:MAG: RHS repeat-associated core domain-containing protein [Candidatus Koribacter versatilis]|uniref:RHS repeat-associated core domain-containing protein n=1 Tax=Candidatus Korobacter versatilis TaxID=658062 RepID=A0A932AAA4_9BACT|nr:RHS repeat-associated core domain-containing protein [Candidatus Koribacter versatilis]